MSYVTTSTGSLTMSSTFDLPTIISHPLGLGSVPKVRLPIEKFIKRV